MAVTVVSHQYKSLAVIEIRRGGSAHSPWITSSVIEPSLKKIKKYSWFKRWIPFCSFYYSAQLQLNQFKLHNIRVIKKKGGENYACQLFITLLFSFHLVKKGDFKILTVLKGKPDMEEERVKTMAEMPSPNPLLSEPERPSQRHSRELIHFVSSCYSLFTAKSIM